MHRSALLYLLITKSSLACQLSETSKRKQETFLWYYFPFWKITSTAVDLEPSVIVLRSAEVRKAIVRLLDTSSAQDNQQLSPCALSCYCFGFCIAVFDLSTSLTAFLRFSVLL